MATQTFFGIFTPNVWGDDPIGAYFSDELKPPTIRGNLNRIFWATPLGILGDEKNP